VLYEMCEVVDTFEVEVTLLPGPMSLIVVYSCPTPSASLITFSIDGLSAAQAMDVTWRDN
jgi:hypothetical protein